MTDTLERNKRTVTAFYDLMINQCKPREAIEQYAGAEYVQHNPGVSDGRKRPASTLARKLNSFASSLKVTT